MKEILKMEDVTYAYEEERMALKGISVEIHEGEKIAVLGNNGAGKSTFFLCCNGILTPQSGKRYLNGALLAKSKKEMFALHQAVGLVFQDPDNQMIAGTVEAEISFGPMNLALSESEVRERVDDAVNCMNLEAFRFRAPQYLSGGEKKRVSIADVLAMKPEMILFDEPAASLDPLNIRVLEENLEKLHAQGLALVIATHDVNFAWKWAERILLFHDGMLVADNKPEKVFSEEKLLKTCGLEQPLLYQVGKLYGLNPLPKTIFDMHKAHEVVQI